MGSSGHAEKDFHVDCPVGVRNISLELDMWPIDLEVADECLGLGGRRDSSEEALRMRSKCES